MTNAATMPDTEVNIVFADDQIALVGSSYLTIGMKWPDKLVDKSTNKEYSFTTDESMEDWMLNEFGGYASYKRIE